MRKLKFKLDRKSLEIVYIAFIRPLLEYGDIIWDNWKKKKTKKNKNKKKKRTWQYTKWGGQYSYWTNKICFSTCFLFRNTMGYSPAKMKSP